MAKIDLVGLYYTKIVKSLKYLRYSFEKVKTYPTNPEQMSEVEFEVWDGFSTRFSRSSDIFLSKFIKAYLKNDDPTFDGSFKDMLNRAEKLGLIENTDAWVDIRELRNVVVNEYSDDDLEIILIKMLSLTPLILDLDKRLDHALKKL